MRSADATPALEQPHKSKEETGHSAKSRKALRKQGKTSSLYTAGRSSLRDDEQGMKKKFALSRIVLTSGLSFLGHRSF